MRDERHILEASSNPSGIPIRLVYESSIATAAHRGTVLVLHGFNSDISHQTKELESLAAQGWLALGVDVIDHGARRAPNFDELYGRNFQQNYASLLRRARGELPSLVDAIEARSWLRSRRLALMGISMGGFITYGAASTEPRIRVLVPLLGSPRWDSQPDSPHLSPEAFLGKALLSLTAGADQNVPPGPARQLHCDLQKFTQLEPGQTRYFELAGAPHLMDDLAWSRLWSQALAWLKLHFARL